MHVIQVPRRVDWRLAEERRSLLKKRDINLLRISVKRKTDSQMILKKWETWCFSAPRVRSRQILKQKMPIEMEWVRCHMHYPRRCSNCRTAAVMICFFTK